MCTKSARHCARQCARFGKLFNMTPGEEFPPGEPDVAPLSSANVVRAAAHLIDAILGICPTDISMQILDEVRVLSASRFRSWSEEERARAGSAEKTAT